MKTKLNEVQKLQKIAGILKENVNEARGGQAAKIKAIISKLKPTDSGGMQFTDYGDELVDVNDIYVFRGGIGIPGYKGVAVGKGIDNEGAAGATLYWLLTGDMESDDPNGYPSGVLEPGEGESDDYDDSSLPSYDQKSKKWFFNK